MLTPIEQPLDALADLTPSEMYVCLAPKSQLLGPDFLLIMLTAQR